METVDYLHQANTWTQRREMHIAQADYCEAQAQRFLGRVAVPDDFKPQLTLIQGEKE